MNNSDKTEKTDFLNVDNAIRGQNYACLSFVSPENVLQNKNLYFVKSYLKTLIKEKNINLDQTYLDDIEEKYKDFLYTSEEKLDQEFSELNNFKTSVRGVKVRGVYDTLVEAQSNAKRLQSTDKHFNVFVGQVGYWLPWDPNPHNIDNQEYYESDLNTLVSKYKENQESKEQHFRENIDYVKEQATKKVTELKKDSIENTLNNSIENTLNEEDPWIKRKLENETTTNETTTNETATNETTENETTANETTTNETTANETTANETTEELINSIENIN